MSGWRPCIQQIINAGLVDNARRRLLAAGSLFRRSEVDLIFLYVSTYALSSTVLPVVQQAKVPVIILNLSPEASIDYDSFNALCRSDADDGGMAGVLFTLPCSGDCECLSAGWYPVSFDHGDAAG